MQHYDPALMVIGAVEWVSLPSLSIQKVRARVDTGAATSALHVENIKPFKRNGQLWVRFGLVEGTTKNWHEESHETRVYGKRKVRNTSGETEERFVIQTQICLGAESWTINLNLSNRDNMRYRMLLGRSALKHRVLVNPSRLYLQKHPKVI